MTHDPIPGFSTYFNRHKGCWAWKEQYPKPNAAELGHVVFADGFTSRGHATAGIRLELKNRNALNRLETDRHETTDHPLHDRQG